MTPGNLVNRSLPVFRQLSTSRLDLLLPDGKLEVNGFADGVVDAHVVDAWGFEVPLPRLRSILGPPPSNQERLQPIPGPRVRGDERVPQGSA